MSYYNAIYFNYTLSRVALWRKFQLNENKTNYFSRYNLQILDILISFDWLKTHRYYA